MNLKKEQPSLNGPHPPSLMPQVPGGSSRIISRLMNLKILVEIDMDRELDGYLQRLESPVPWKSL
jgi:hypothetical protein